MNEEKISTALAREWRSAYGQLISQQKRKQMGGEDCTDVSRTDKLRIWTSYGSGVFSGQGFRYVGQMLCE